MRQRRGGKQWQWTVEYTENSVKDVVKMVSVLRSAKFLRTAAEKFGTIQTSGPKALPKGSRVSTERLRPLQFTEGVS